MHRLLLAWHGRGTLGSGSEFGYGLVGDLCALSRVGLGKLSKIGEAIDLVAPCRRVVYVDGGW